MHDVRRVDVEPSRAKTKIRPPVLERRLTRCAHNVETFGAHYPYHENRHLLPGHEIPGTEQARSTASRDAAAGHLLDVRAERA